VRVGELDNLLPFKSGALYNPQSDEEVLVLIDRQVYFWKRNKQAL